MTTYTLFLSHVMPYESANFTKAEAWVSIILCKCCNIFGCGLWHINVPVVVNRIARIKIAPENDEVFHDEIDHEQLALGFRFLADMINRLCFLLVLIATLVAFSLTILKTMIETSDDITRLDSL